MPNIFGGVFSSLIGDLEQRGMSHEDASKAVSFAQQEYQRARSQEPPKIALMGFAGVGKSTTVNAIFNAGREVGAVLPCTKEPGIVHTQIEQVDGSKGAVIIYDMPGLGEDILLEDKYLAEYDRLLPEVDVAVWLIDSNNRALAPIQSTILHFLECNKSVLSKIVFGVNKVDAIAPGETRWKTATNLPSREQAKNIEDFKGFVEQGIRNVNPTWTGEVHMYSAKRAFQLQELVTAMIEAIPPERRWVTSERTDTPDPYEQLDPCLRKYITSQMGGAKR